MMSRRAFGLSTLWLLAGSAGAALAGCSGRNKALRYRVTVEVDTPSGLKTGASVMESVSNPGNAFQYSARAWTYGEAPTVDLGNGRYLFALLSDPFDKRTMYQMLLRVLRYPETRPPLADPNASAFDQANETKPFGVVRREDYPMLVTFGDTSDPDTVAEVNPDNLTASLEGEYRLRRITVQVVDADVPLSEEIMARLKWIGPSPETRLNKTYQGDTNVPLSRRLSNGNFISRRA